MKDIVYRYKNAILCIGFIFAVAGIQYRLHINARPLDLNDPTEMTLSRLESAASRKSVPALLLLGNMYSAGVHGVKENKDKALEYYKTSAKLGSAEGAYNAALLSSNKNPRETLELLWQAYKGGIVEAESLLGNYLVRSGEKEQGEILLIRSSQKFSSRAMLQLADIHKEGILNNSSMTESMYWLLLSQRFEQDNLQKMILDDKIQSLGKDMESKDLTEAEIRSSAWFLGSLHRK